MSSSAPSYQCSSTITIGLALQHLLRQLSSYPTKNSSTSCSISINKYFPLIWSQQIYHCIILQIGFQVARQCNKEPWSQKTAEEIDAAGTCTQLPASEQQQLWAAKWTFSCKIQQEQQGNQQQLGLCI